MSNSDNSQKKEESQTTKKENSPPKMTQEELEALFEVYLQMKNYVAEKQKNK